MAGLQNPKCFARELGGCSGKISREHYISEGVLKQVAHDDKALLAVGWDFLPPGHVQCLPIKGMASHILCTTHNSALSDFDSAAEQLARGFNRLKHAALNPSTGPETFIISGDNLERWMLKSLLGCLYSGVMVRPGDNTMKGQLPPKVWLDNLFTGTRFPTGQGLHIRPGRANRSEDGRIATFGAGPIRHQSRGNPDVYNVLGFTIFLLGFQLSLKLHLSQSDNPAGVGPARFRPAGIRAEDNPIGIMFEWAEGPGFGDLVVTRAGGERQYSHLPPESN